ncbi:MAG: hypothetical protein QM662_05255 [Gordonia sp. (in: high G+C Gram-positive bacteria)]
MPESTATLLWSGRLRYVIKVDDPGMFELLLGQPPAACSMANSTSVAKAHSRRAS